MTAALLPVGAGLVSALAIAVILRGHALLRHTGTLAVLLGAIAAFYPVFAIEAGSAVIFHFAVFALFLAVALLGLRRGAVVLALGLAGHGLFDLAMGLAGSPAPDWWAAFCGTLDIALAVLVWRWR